MRHVILSLTKTVNVSRYIVNIRLLVGCPFKQRISFALRRCSHACVPHKCSVRLHNNHLGTFSHKTYRSANLLGVGVYPKDPFTLSSPCALIHRIVQMSHGTVTSHNMSSAFFYDRSPKTMTGNAQGQATGSRQCRYGLGSDFRGTPTTQLGATCQNNDNAS